MTIEATAHPVTGEPTTREPAYAPRRRAPRRTPSRGVLLAAAAVAALVATAGTTLVLLRGGEPAPDAGQLVNTGLQQVIAGDTASAEKSFEAALDVDPDNVLAHYNLGYLDQQAGDPVGAVGSYLDALEADKDYAPALYNLAILTERTDLDAAVGFYRRVLVLQPDDARTHVRLGYALRHLGERAEGTAQLKAGFALDPSLKTAPAPVYPS